MHKPIILTHLEKERELKVYTSEKYGRATIRTLVMVKVPKVALKKIKEKKSSNSQVTYLIIKLIPKIRKLR